MQKKLQKYIDLLIEMAGSDNNYEVIKEELSEVEKDIEAKKTELKNIKKSMKDDKYLKENDRIIDENIKIGIENKKQVYQQELDKILKIINKASVDEEDNHQALTSVISRLKSLNALLNVLQEKLKVVNKDKSLSSFYENMIENTTKEISELEKKKELLSKQYEQVREKLDYYGNSRVELEKKLKHLDVRLEDTLEALSTPNFYVDELLKKKDENKVDELNKELEDLENHRLILITDPIYIGNQAMKMYNDDDYTSSLSSIKELVTIVKAKPHMNESKKELNALLKQTEATLDEFANNIENNTYLGEDSKIIENRITYLNSELETINNEISEINKRIVDIDKNIVQNISNELKETENLYIVLKDAYEEYKKIVLTTDDTISPRKKANLQTAYNRKKEEMDLVYNLFEKYQKELEDIIMQSKKLETVDLVELENRKENILDEIDELKKVKANKTKTKDILAMEKDKETLNKLSIDVDNIKHSLKYDKSADDIYKEIEGLFGNEETEIEEEEQPTLVKKEFVNLDDFKIEEEPIYDINPISDEIDYDEKGLSTVNDEPVVEESSNVIDNEPVVEESSSVIGNEPVVEESSSVIDNEPVVEESPIVVGNESVVEESPSVIDNEPIVEESPIVIGNEPVAEESPIVIGNEPVVEESPIVIGNEPVVEGSPIVIGNEPVAKESLIINDNVFLDSNNVLANSEVSVLDDSTNVFRPDEKILQVADENLEDTKVFPPRNSIEERYKVINIEELPKKEVNKPVEKTETLGETIESLDNSYSSLDDNLNNTSEYISFNDILNGDGYNGN